MTTRKIQQAMAKAAKRNSLKQVEAPKELVAELKGEKPAKKEETKKAERKPRVDTSAPVRQKVVALIEKVGFKGVEKSGWIRFNVKDARIAVASKGPQVHFRGFEFKHSGVEQLSDNEAKKRHLGSVRQILWLDRQSGEVCEDVIRTALK